MDTWFKHPTAIVETIQIGEGTRIWAFAHVMPNVEIGANCNVGDHCFVESGARVGDNVTIKNGNMIWEGVMLEHGVFVGPHVTFTNDLYPRSPRLPEARARYSSHSWLSCTRVKYGATLGAGAVILAGTTIGEFGFVGAGAVVTQDVPPYALVVGNPARIIGWVCSCGQRLDFRGEFAQCPACGLEFTKSSESVSPYTPCAAQHIPGPVRSP